MGPQRDTKYKWTKQKYEGSCEQVFKSSGDYHTVRSERKLNSLHSFPWKCLITSNFMELFWIVPHTLCPLGLNDWHLDRPSAGIRNLSHRNTNLFYLLGRRPSAHGSRSVDAGEDENTNDRWVSNPDIPTKLVYTKLISVHIQNIFLLFYFFLYLLYINFKLLCIS